MVVVLSSDSFWYMLSNFFGKIIKKKKINY